MPDAQPKIRKPGSRAVLSREQIRKLPPVPKPSTPYPGYMTDEWFEYLRDTMVRATHREVRARLVGAGITDKEGKYTAPYRAG